MPGIGIAGTGGFGSDGATSFGFAQPPTSVTYKMVILVREELRMGAGKVAAQCVHAALGAYRTRRGRRRRPSALHAWQMTGEATIVLKVPDLQASVLWRVQPPH